ncbi:metalloendoproteinase 5-MMP-like [Vigna unguiculata]|uniref:Gelatinase A n=1 Tax=Vigna unguiculata TaxID=3917 RepID=A0A4D6LPV9_VIGUN|nr:metalloendoproteinase 5-MMP-like [Vigna unguiculata]QCD90561.1 gelatinase A [Vigna unguiculata]
MKKPFLSAFLLLSLLLLDQSHFAKAGIGSSVASWFKSLNSEKIINYVKGKKAPKPEWDNEFYNYVKPDPKLPNLPLNKERKGFAPLKEYLSNFGYLPSSDSYNNTVDQQTLSAIKTFQESFDLPVTGDIDSRTLKLIKLPRCAVPDMDFNYSFTQNVSWPKAGHRWFRKRSLTYGFLPESEVQPNATRVFKTAFTRWANATGSLNLTETTYDDADIKIGFYNFSDSVVGDLYGFSFITENPPSDVLTAEINLNGNMYWALPSEKEFLSAEDGILDLESAAMHQIGHLLGFDHSFKNDSVMYPYILPSQERKVELSISDKNNIRKQFANADSANGGCLGVPSITTLLLSLGFACMLLMC